MAPMPAVRFAWAGWLRSVVAVLSTAAALVLTVASLHVVLDRAVFMLLAVPAVLSAVLLGPVPGLVATATAALGARLFVFRFVEPGPGDELAWWLLIVVGLVVSAASAGLRRSRRVAEQALAGETLATDALRASEARLRAIIEDLDTGLVVSDSRGSILQVNRAARDIYQVPRLPPVPLRDFARRYEFSTLDGRVLDYEEWPLVRAIAGGTVRDVELRCRRLDVEWERLLLFNAVHTADPGGETLVLLSTRDISQAKRTEAALRDERDRLARLAETVPGVIFTFRVDAEGRFSFPYVSHRVRDLYGLGPEDVAADATPLRERWHPDDVEKILSSIEASRRGLTPWQLEFRVLHPARGVIWLDGRSMPVADTDGSVNWHGVLVDVTERRRAEAALHESSTRFRQVVENIREVFWMSSTDQRELFYVSPGYEHVWGRPVAELYANPPAWIESIHEEDRDVAHQAARTQQATGRSDVEYRIVRPDGTIRWIHDRAFPVRDAEGRIYRVAGLAEDITARRQLEAQYQQSQKMEAVGQLASGIAHDFNNLLTVIQGNASLIQMGLPDAAEVQDCAQQVVLAAARAAALTRQLLIFSRRPLMQPLPLDLNETVHGLTRMLSRVVGEHIEIVEAYEPGLPPVLGDAGMIEQAIVNLVVNARDAMPGGGRLTIRTARLRLERDRDTSQPPLPPGDYVQLVVEDTGGGIAPEHLPHVFEPFFTTKDVGKGTGLGLATVYGVVRQHGGHIEVASELQHGTTVRLWLPATEPDEPAPGDAIPSGVLPGGSETLLLVEDEPSVRAFAETVLQRCGYTVLTAASGEEALEAWRRAGANIALLLTDVVIPGGMSGIEVAARLRDEAPGLPVIYSSGYSDELSDARVQLDERSRFLPKPYPPAALAQTVRDTLDGR